MSTFNFNAPINGQVQAGDHTTMNVHESSVTAAPVAAQENQGQSEAVLRLAQRLVEVLAHDNPPLVEQAEAIRAEVERSGESGEAPDTGRIRRRLELISSGVAAGSGALALVEGIIHAVGG
jgi:hypothetical protein